MTVIQELKALDVCGTNSNNIADCTTGVLNMKCCSNGSNSDISIDKALTPSTSSSSSAIIVSNSKRSSSIKFPPCKRVDLKFENVKYTVRKFSFADRNFITKEILHGVNGSFHSGELTAVMGPSGSGKSTLLNVLSGFRTAGFEGTIRVNSMPISTNSKKFRELSCYIQQDDALRPQLTVNEVMMLAANLKLGFSITKDQKQNLVNHILSQLSLSHRTNVYGAKLSGGQKRRLAIALELISNPPVLYLDEPTSGLDSSSCSKCVQLLKKLASQGHTIICTIHQPSAMIFEMFDKLYTLVGGYCIYQGSIKELVPFLAKQNLLCPTYHNPADFLLEVAVGDHGSDVNKLINAAAKKHSEDSGSNQTFISQIPEVGDLKVNALLKSINNFFGNFALLPWDNEKLPENDLVFEVTKSFDSHELQEPTVPLKIESHQLINFILRRPSFFIQYFLLLRRNLLCAQRNYRPLSARLFSHLFVAVLFGYIYQNVGEKATTVLGNYVYIYGTTLLLLYTGKMSVILTVPLEIEILKREHFNRWYNLAPYLLAILSFEIPFQSLCALIYLVPSAYLTSNDSTDNARIYYFLALSVLLSLSAQAWGFFIGVNLPIKLAIFLGPILGVLFSVFGFCTRYIDINPLFRWMWHISYFRAAFHGSLNAIYGMGRSLLPCPKEMMYCHFRSPKVFLNFMMINEVNMRDSFVLMLSVIIIMYLMTMITLWHKISKR